MYIKKIDVNSDILRCNFGLLALMSSAFPALGDVDKVLHPVFVNYEDVVDDETVDGDVVKAEYQIDRALFDGF